MSPSLDIVIVNWNAGQQLRDCLESIVATHQEGFALEHVVVVDNASSDNSLDGLDSLPLPLTIIRNPDNRGFGAACNQGAAACDSKYVLFLNPDTELRENSLVVPMTFMEEGANQRVGICGIQLVDENGQVARSCAHFPSLPRFTAQAIGLNRIPGLRGAGVHMTEWDHLSDRQVDHVIGAFYFVRRSVFEVLNGFDEQFFVYLEDVDLSLRAKQAGWKTAYNANAQAFHQGGGTSQQVKAMRLYYILRSQLQYGFKHFTRWQSWALVGVTMFVEPVSRILFVSMRRQWGSVLDTLRGYRMLWKELVNIVHSHEKG